MLSDTNTSHDHICSNLPIYHLCFRIAAAQINDHVQEIENACLKNDLHICSPCFTRGLIDAEMSQTSTGLLIKGGQYRYQGANPDKLTLWSHKDVINALFITLIDPPQLHHHGSQILPF